ncbi:phosphotransferase enzyme family protein [Nocardiopsis potens]|uniref:phosphotransferase enzyme family protein n=1 Tax=Nocardiopsis potens TaxID=1246458 RepID=UPI000349779C|nr:phosphotransferase [Nocardiopsis potens]
MGGGSGPVARLTPDPGTAREICRRYGLPERGAALHPVARGANGRVWRLESPGGRYAVKELFWTDEVGEEEAARAAAYRDAAAREGVRAPRDVPGADGRYLALLAPEHGGALVRLCTWAEGVRLRGTGGGAAAWLGRALAALHRVGAPPAGPEGAWFTEVPGEERWAELVEEGRRTGAAWAPALAGAVPLIRELSRWAAPAAGPLITSHRDVKPDNVLRAGDGGHVLLDWDATGTVSARRELATALMDWHHGAGGLDEGGVRATLAAYRAAGGPASVGAPEDFGMHLAALLNYVHVQALGERDPGLPDDERRYALSQVERSLPRLPEPAVLERVMELARGRPPGPDPTRR